MKTFTRLTIGECGSEEQAKEFRRIWHDEPVDVTMLDAKVFVSGRLLEEEGGRMVVIETTWRTREACIAFHASRGFRQFIAKTQHLLIGDFVVKLFVEEKGFTVIE